MARHWLSRVSRLLDALGGWVASAFAVDFALIAAGPRRPAAHLAGRAASAVGTGVVGDIGARLAGHRLGIAVGSLRTTDVPADEVRRAAGDPVEARLPRVAAPVVAGGFVEAATQAERFDATVQFVATGAAAGVLRFAAQAVAETILIGVAALVIAGLHAGRAAQAFFGNAGIRWIAAGVAANVLGLAAGAGIGTFADAGFGAVAAHFACTRGLARTATEADRRVQALFVGVAAGDRAASDGTAGGSASSVAPVIDTGDVCRGAAGQGDGFAHGEARPAQSRRGAGSGGDTGTGARGPTTTKPAQGAFGVGFGITVVAGVLVPVSLFRGVAVLGLASVGGLPGDGKEVGQGGFEVGIDVHLDDGATVFEKDVVWIKLIDGHRDQVASLNQTGDEAVLHQEVRGRIGTVTDRGSILDERLYTIRYGGHQGPGHDQLAVGGHIRRDPHGPVLRIGHHTPGEGELSALSGGEVGLDLKAVGLVRAVGQLFAGVVLNDGGGRTGAGGPIAAGDGCNKEHGSLPTQFPYPLRHDDSSGCRRETGSM